MCEELHAWNLLCALRGFADGVSRLFKVLVTFPFLLTTTPQSLSNIISLLPGGMLI